MERLFGSLTNAWRFAGLMVDEVYSYFDPFYFDLYADGIIVYDRECYGQKLLERIGKKVKEQGWVRYKTKDGYYGWTLKDLKFGQVIEVNFDDQTFLPNFSFKKKSLIKRNTMEFEKEKFDQKKH